MNDLIPDRSPARSAAEPPAAPTARSRPPAALTAVAIGYSLSWIAGLSVWSSSTKTHASGARVVHDYAAHSGAAAVQFVLTEGLPAVGLAVVGLALAAAARRAGAQRAASVAAATSVAAAAVSLVQCVLGLVLALSAAPDGRSGQAHLLFETVNRLDGVKMFLLAGLAVAGAFAAAVLPRWLCPTSWALAVTIAGSGVGYLFLLDSFSPLAYVSLPLLLLWVTGGGIVLARRAP